MADEGARTIFRQLRFLGVAVGWHCQVFTYHSEVAASDVTSKQAIVADAVEAWGQDVQQEAADELIDGDAHGLMARPAFASIVFEAERDPAFIQGDEPAVSDGDPVCVSGEIGQHRFGSGKGALA